MEIEDLKAIIDRIDKSYITSFEYKDSQISIKITKPKHNQIQYERKTLSEIACSVNKTSMFEIKSEYVGIIKLINQKDNKPFVIVNQKVYKGDLLCIIEILKINIEIRSQVLGYVREICVEDNTMVDYMKKLFVIELV